MKKWFLIVATILCHSAIAFSQYQFAPLEKAKEIKLLRANQPAVRSLMGNYEAAYSVEDLDRFVSEEATIEVKYSTDTCGGDDEAIWDVPVGRATSIEIFPDKELKFEDLGYDPSALSKEQFYSNVPDYFIFHDKKRGFGVEVDEGKVEKFILFPALNGRPKACSKNRVAKEFVSSKSWFGKSKLEDRNRVISCPVASVADLTLSTEEFKELGLSKEVSVTTTATDPDGDVLSYHYLVTAGKIVGKGPVVVWNLRDVKSGTYTITAGVDDGCGLCGVTKTKTVVIK